MLGPLLERRELVTVDMRGTGHSRAIDCPALQRAAGSDAHGVAQCARILGPSFVSYRTSAAADDLDAVREALGLERITIYGDSYGTFLAQSYAYRHGESLDVARHRQRLPGSRRERLVSEPDPDRDPRAGDRLPALEPLLRDRRANGWRRWSSCCARRRAAPARC